VATLEFLTVGKGWRSSETSREGADQAPLRGRISGDFRRFAGVLAQCDAVSAGELGVDADEVVFAAPVGAVITCEPVRGAEFHVACAAPAAGIDEHGADRGVVRIIYVELDEALVKQVGAGLAGVRGCRAVGYGSGGDERVLYVLPAVQSGVAAGAGLGEPGGLDQLGVDAGIIPCRGVGRTASEGEKWAGREADSESSLCFSRM